MKTKYIFASLLVASLTFAGCEDMDTLPEGSTVTSSQKEEIGQQDPTKIAARVNAIFAQFNQYMPNAGALNAERHNDIGYPSVMLFTDTNGNDVVSDNNGYNWAGSDLDYTDRSQTSLECQMVWNDMYSIVYASNNVISGIAPQVEDPTEQYYLAQGLGARAFAYWVMAQLYQFNYKGNETKPCVPLITEKNMEEAATKGCPRATVQDVYTQITTDLASAIDLLTKSKVKRTDKRYISLAVAYGLSARVNLTMHEYGAAATAADNAIKAAATEGLAPSKYTEKDNQKILAPAFWSSDEQNWMWGIIVSETDRVVTSGIVNWPSHMGSMSYGYANYSGGRQINKELYEAIPNSDARKGWWLGADLKSNNLTEDQQAMMTDYGYRAYTQVKFAPYKNELETSVNANDIPLMRIEEMYLIKAEGEAMSGQDGKTTLVNFVKNYRDPSYSPGTDIQEEVFKQRRIELWGEGLNWFDLMRLNKGVDRRGAGYPNSEMIFKIEPTDNVLLWPIPEVELQSNQALSEADQNTPGNTPKPVADNK